MTSRLNLRGEASGFDGGYGPLTAALSSFKAFTEAGDAGEWLRHCVRTNRHAWKDLEDAQDGYLWLVR